MEAWSVVGMREEQTTRNGMGETEYRKNLLDENYMYIKRQNNFNASTITPVTTPTTVTQL